MSASSVVRDNLLYGVEVTQLKLGGGGYGSVFLGIWHGRQVAVKRLHTTVMGIDENGRPTKAFVRFTKELPILQQLSHPSIVQVFGMVPPPSHEASHGLVMELLPVTLRSRYEQEPQLTHGQEVSIMASVTSGLQYLHHKGILHRDLTSSNVMLVERAGCESVPVRAKIIDAGVARVLADVDVKEMTMTLAPGAERYSAPEARTARGDEKAKYGRPADIYSLGVTVMAMCNHREPPSVFDLAEHGRKSDLALMKGLRNPLYGIVSKCVEEDSSVRPTCLQLCKELAKLQLRYPAAVVSQRSGDGAASDENAAYTDDDVAPLRDQLYEVSLERDTLRQENDQLTENLSSVTAEKDAAVAENERSSQNLADALVKQESIARVLDRVEAERYNIIRERNQAVAASEQAIKDRDEAAAKREQLGRERDEALTCRDRLDRDRAEAIRDREKAVTDKERLDRERNEAICVRDKAMTDNDRLAVELAISLKERNHAIAASQDQVRLVYRVTAERDGIATERDQLAAKCDQLDADKRQQQQRLVAANAERDQVAVKVDQLAAERDQLAAERDQLAAERDKLAAERDQLAAECDQLDAEKRQQHKQIVAADNARHRAIAMRQDQGWLFTQVTAERDAIAAKHEQLAAEKRQHLEQLAAVKAERDRVIAESQDKVRLVNQLATERDGVPVECGSLAAEGHGQIQLAAANAIVSVPACSFTMQEFCAEVESLLQLDDAVLNEVFSEGYIMRRDYCEIRRTLYRDSKVKKFLNFLPYAALSCFICGLRKSPNPLNHRLAEILAETPANLSQSTDI